MTLDGAPLPPVATAEALAAAANGWLNAGRNLVLAKAPAADVHGPATALRPSRCVRWRRRRRWPSPATAASPSPAPASTSRAACRRWADWDPARAIRLDPSIYWDYITDPPPGHNGPGPSAPVWTGVVAGLPPDTAFEWKCLRRREDGSGAPDWEPGANNVHSTTASGYAGLAHGSF